MKQLLTIFSFFTAISLFAQPSNDDCIGLIDLGLAPVCSTTDLYNNVDATESDIGDDNFPNCFVGVPSRDVWFAFTTVDTILNYRITLTGCPDPSLGFPSIVNPQIAVYRGDTCLMDELQLLSCASAAAGETTVVVDLDGLTPGLPYYLRINDWSSTATPNSGAFKLCVEKQPPINTVDEGSSTECTGTLTDTGGPDGDYGNNEDFVYTICPSTPTGCINFTMEYYNIENNSDQIIFYDGPNTTSPQIGALDGGAFGSATYGGVCYSVSASSGCLTIQFISDATATYEGFLGHWECSPDACIPVDPIEVTVGNLTPDQIVESVVLGQTLVTVTDVKCSNGSVGIFQAGANSDLGLEKGLLLTSGSALAAAGPNTEGFTGSDNGRPGDQDLNILSEMFSTGDSSYNACIVELDVYASGDLITFEYVFGSEEYPEWVNNGYNDIFAFLVSGPGITGIPAIGNQLNVASLPNGTFVEINNINEQQNWQYYRDNFGGQSVIYDGLTSDSLGFKKSLTARIPTIPCNTYHLKLAVADRGDTAYDSGVFISEINGGWPEIGVNYQSGIDYLIEDCTNVPDELSISIDAELSQPVEFIVQVDGTATQGVDYTLTVPPTLTFQTGTEIFTFPIQVLTDNLTEGIETVVVHLLQDVGCDTVEIATATLEIHDQLQVEILDDFTDTVIVCASDNCAQLMASGASSYEWTPAGIMSNDTIPNPIACIDNDQWVTVTGKLGPCLDTDSIFLDFTNVQVEINPAGPITACQGDTITLNAVNTVNNANLIWTGFPTPVNPNDPIQKVSPPPGNTFVFLTVSVGTGGCVATDDIQLTFNPYDVPVVSDDVTICENFSVDLASDITSTTTTYQWSPNFFLDPGPNVSGPVATPDVTTTYQLITNGSNGACIDTFEVTITVIPIDVEVLNPDTVFICLGDTATLNIQSSTGGAGISWVPQSYLTPVSLEEVKVYPPFTTPYYAVLNTGIPLCPEIQDSVLVYVDSLPNLAIMAIPDKESYCQGEEITLYSETYEPSNHMGLTNTWIGGTPGSLTPDSFLNLVLLASETFTYMRVDSVHACKDTNSIEIIVTPVATISVTPSDTAVCSGNSVQFTVNGSPGLTNINWTPPQGLDDPGSLTPIAMPAVSTTYMVSAEFEGCPVPPAIANITVTPGPQIIFPTNVNICQGSQVLLNSANDPGAIYVWNASDGSLMNDTIAQPTVSPMMTTTYTVTATKGADCEVTRSITIFVAEDFTASIEPVTGVLCPGDPITLVANPGNALNPTYEWTIGNSPTEVGTGQTLDVGPLGETTDFFVKITDGIPCFDHTVSVTVEVSTAFDLNVPDTVFVNQGENVTITASVDPPGLMLNYLWLEEGETIGLDSSITVNSCRNRVYNVTVSDENGCSKAALVFLKVEEGFTVDSVTYTNVSVDTSSVYEGQEIFLTAHLDPPIAIQNATFDWFVNNILVSTTSDTISETINAPEVDEDTPFDISVLITTTTGCAVAKLDTMTVFDNPVELPNAFSPNNDDINDTFQPISKIPITILTFKVWNRWGQLVYDNEKGIDGWDGKQGSTDAPSDVYVYFLQYQITGGNTGAHSPVKGDVTLLR